MKTSLIKLEFLQSIIEYYKSLANAKDEEILVLEDLDDISIEDWEKELCTDAPKSNEIDTIMHRFDTKVNESGHITAKYWPMEYVQSFKNGDDYILRCTVANYDSFYLITKPLLEKLLKETEIVIKNIKQNIYDVGYYKLTSEYSSRLRSFNFARLTPLTLPVVEHNFDNNPIYIDLVNDIEFFTKHINDYSELNIKPYRKYLLYGSPGTGKTTLLNNLYDKYKDEYIIVQIDNVSQITNILEKTTIDKPLMLIDEDSKLQDTAESSYGLDKILSILDGNAELIANHKLPIIYIATANDNRKIHKSIINRPGRIDKIIKIDLLNNKDAIGEAVKIYFGQFTMSDDDFGKLITTFVNSTYAEMKEVSMLYLKRMFKDNKLTKEINVDIVRSILTEIQVNIAEARSFDAEDDFERELRD